jgi:GNAT superfamily N-acetyltransferase
MSRSTSAGIVIVRPAAPSDAPRIHALVVELAAYERLAHEVQASAESLAEALFGPRPAAEALVAEADGQVVGYALFFTNYSTFVGRPGVYLEDLYVQPAFRGRGIGRQLLAAVAGLAVERRCGRLEWAVLDWNEPSIEFYKRLGARPMADWTVYRLTGEALHRAATLPEDDAP